MNVFAFTRNWTVDTGSNRRAWGDLPLGIEVSRRELWMEVCAANSLLAPDAVMDGGPEDKATYV